jgi:hypothetical protein
MRLRTALEASEWSLLVSYLENEKLKDTWLENDSDIPKHVFVREIHRVLDKSRSTLEKISK